jgi:hypothetical protein
MVIRGCKSAFLVHVAIMLLLLVPSVSLCGEITVQPGKFDHFDIKIPQKITAGDKVPVEITAVDSFNNIIPNFNDSRREFSVSASGSASVSPSTLSSTSFVKGTATISLRDTAAESFTLTIFESGNTTPLQARDIHVAPGKLASLIVRGPRAVPAGDKFDVKIFAVDSFGNPVSEQISGKNINILFKGGADPKIAGDSVADFRNAVGTVTLRSEKAGAFTMEVRDLVTGSTGTSEWIDIVNNTLASFRLLTPKEIIAGEPFEVSITAVDAFNNVVKNYTSTGSGIMITSSGAARPFPSNISAYEFVGGQAKVALRYDTTANVHSITLTATETNRKNHGTSERIKVTVYNQIGNPLKNYNLIGPDVVLTASGSGKLTPSRIPASEFVNGAALVDVQYNKSEAFSIVANPVSSVKASEAAAEKKKKSSREEARTAHKGAEPGSKPAITKARIPEETLTRPLDITGVSLVESKKRTVVSIHIPSLTRTAKLTYGARPTSKDGKKWIAVNISPAINKVIEPVVFDSSSVGKVLVEGDPGSPSSIIIKIENLKAAKFKIRRGDKSIAVTIAH